MPNLNETHDVIVRFLKARVPLIILRSIEHSRAREVVESAAREVRSMTFYVHSRTSGLTDLLTDSLVSDDRSLAGALDFAAESFSARSNANFVFSDVEDLDTESSTSRHLAEMARLAEARQGSIVILAAGPVWSSLARLGMTAILDLPDLDELSRTVGDLIDDHRSVMPIEWSKDEVRRAAEILVGVTQTEAINAVSTLLAKGALKTGDLLELSHFKDQIFGDLTGIEKISLRENDYEVGGLGSLRGWLTRRYELITADLSDSPLHPPKGVLLVGVPGCGKSLSAKAIAAEWRLPLYRLDVASVLGMYVGQSETQLREALEAAERVAPCVLWVDEIEKAFSSSGGDSGTTRRLVGQFLFWLQESTSKVFLVATANDVSSLPPELLRKGRFDEIFFVDLPDDGDRVEIIRLYFEKYLRNSIEPETLEKLVELSSGFSGADIESVVHDIATELFVSGITGPPTQEFVERMFANVMPFSATNPEEVAAIRMWGRERAVPAGRVSAANVDKASAGRRVVVVS